MAYVSPNGTSNLLASKDLEDFAGLSEFTQDRLLRTAYRTVKKLAPPPDPETPTQDYQEAARDAEVAVLGFLVATDGGIVKSSALSGVDNTSYVGLDAVQRIVGHAMGGYYVGEVVSSPSNTGGASVFNVSDEPLF